MRTPLEAEAEVAEYVLGLDALGLGGKAQTLYWRAMARDIRPLLLRQKALLEADGARDLRDADWDEVLEHLRESPAPTQTEAVLRLDAELVAAWERLLEQLRVLWLTEGRGVVPEEAA